MFLFNGICISSILQKTANFDPVLMYRHTASIAAGNHGVPVIVSGHRFGNASGMAPRAQ